MKARVAQPPSAVQPAVTGARDPVMNGHNPPGCAAAYENYRVCVSAFLGGAVIFGW